MNDLAYIIGAALGIASVVVPVYYVLKWWLKDELTTRQRLALSFGVWAVTMVVL